MPLNSSDCPPGSTPWVLVNTLTYGQISKFYAVLPFQMQSAISKEF